MLTVKVEAFLQLFWSRVAKDLKQTSNERKKEPWRSNPVDKGILLKTI